MFARQFVPDLPRALLLDSLPDDWLDRLQVLECIALDVNHRLLTPQIIDAAHAAGFRVLCYTVNEAERAQQLLDWGVDSLITDAVDVIASSL